MILGLGQRTASVVSELLLLVPSGTAERTGPIWLRNHS